MNSVNIIGRTTKEIELTKSQTGMSVAKFTIAVDEFYNKQKQTSFFNCSCFGNPADNLGKFVRKGNQIALSGHLHQGSYESNGKKVSFVEIIVDNFTFIAGQNANNQNNQSSYNSSQNYGTAPAQAPMNSQGYESNMEIPDDGLPF